jgi:hypothetical protein
MLSLTSSHLLQRLEDLLLPPFPLSFHQPLSLHHLSYVTVVPLFKSLALSLSQAHLIAPLKATRTMLPFRTSGMQRTTFMAISRLRRLNPIMRLALAALSLQYLSHCHLLPLRTTENQHQLLDAAGLSTWKRSCWAWASPEFAQTPPSLSGTMRVPR